MQALLVVLPVSQPAVDTRRNLRPLRFQLVHWIVLNAPTTTTPKEGAEVNVGDEVTAAAFEGVNYVDIVATGKGRGFQGVVKRYDFGGGRASHGGGWVRRTGSIGMCEFPARVFKGKKMSGHMGNVRRTMQNLEVVRVDAERNLLLIKGSVPGYSGGKVIVRPAGKYRNKGASA